SFIAKVPSISISTVRLSLPGRRILSNMRLSRRVLLYLYALLFQGLCCTGFAQSSIQQADLFCKKADSLIRIPKLKDAFDYSMKALRSYQERGTWEQYLHSLDLVSTCGYTLAGAEAEQALNLLKEASKSTDADSSKRRSSGVVYYHLGQYLAKFTPKTDSAIHLLIKARALRKKYDGEVTKEVALVDYGLGTIYQFKKFDFIHAEEYYEKSLETLEKIDSADSHLLARNYYTLATTNRAQG